MIGSTLRTEVGREFVSHVPTSVSLCVAEDCGIFEAADGGNRFFNAAKLFVISEADSCEPSVIVEILGILLGVLFDSHRPLHNFDDSTGLTRLSCMVPT